MKAKLLIILSLLSILCTSCIIEFGTSGFYADYWLFLSFQDASGCDLLEGVETEHWEELHTLSLVFSEPCMNTYSRRRLSNSTANISISNLTDREGRNYIEFPISSDYGRDCPGTAGMITLRLTCPHVFGDNDIHEIETCWIQESQGRSYGVKCYRIVIGDREFTDIRYEGDTRYNDNTSSVATITLDR